MPLMKMSASANNYIEKLKEINHKVIISNDVNEVFKHLEEYYLFCV